MVEVELEILGDDRDQLYCYIREDGKPKGWLNAYSLAEVLDEVSKSYTERGWIPAGGWSIDQRGIVKGYWSDPERDE